MMSSRCLCVWALIGCRCATQRVRQPVLFRWELVSCSHGPSQSASPVWKLLTETFLPSWCFGIYQASAASSIIHDLSSGFLCLSVCLCVCMRMPVCTTVCVVTACSQQTFGEPRSSLRICFFSLLPGTHACFCGHSWDRSTMPHLWTLQHIYVEPFHVEDFYWQELLTVPDLLDAYCYYHPNCRPDLNWTWLKVSTFLLLDLFCWLVKMPEANYLLSVSWGYIKVRCGLWIFKQIFMIDNNQCFSPILKWLFKFIGDWKMFFGNEVHASTRFGFWIRTNWL